jgi:hypothetical protein
MQHSCNLLSSSDFMVIRCWHRSLQCFWWKRCFARRWTEEGLRLNDPLWYSLSIPRSFVAATTSFARSCLQVFSLQTLLALRLPVFCQALFPPMAHTPLELFLASPAVVWLSSMDRTPLASPTSLSSSQSVQKAAQAPPVAAPTQAPPVSAAVAPVAEAPAQTAPAPSEDISSFKSYFSSLTDTKPKEEAPEQPKPLTAAELRAKRVAEVAKREREEAERKREEAERKAAEQVNTPLSHLFCCQIGGAFGGPTRLTS